MCPSTGGRQGEGPWPWQRLTRPLKNPNVDGCSSQLRRQAIFGPQILFQISFLSLYPRTAAGDTLPPIAPSPNPSARLWLPSALGIFREPGLQTHYLLLSHLYSSSRLGWAGGPILFQVKFKNRFGLREKEWSWGLPAFSSFTQRNRAP